MSDKRDLEKLLKNIQKGLKKYSISDLNKAVIDLLHKDDKKINEAEYIIDIVCADYGVTKRKLSSTNVRGHASDAKQLLYCLLHFELGFSIRNVAYNIFKQKWHYQVSKAIVRFKRLNPDVKGDRIMLEKYKLYALKLDEYIKSKQEKI